MGCEAACEEQKKPVFAHIMGLAERSGESDYRLTCSFEDIINLLIDTFNARVYFASRNLWDTVYNPYTRTGTVPERYVLTMLFGAPEACLANIELLCHLGKRPKDINDSDVLQLLAKVRKTPFAKLDQKEPISEDEVLMMMKMTVGVAKLGFPEPPRTSNELIHWWES